jgi:RimJ/RimL family protein N-acetyltransferase
MRWVGEGKPITREDCEKWFDITETNYQTRGYGMFALEHQVTGLVVGCCGLIHPGGQPEVEIKYAFLQDQWGKGLATEVVPELLRYGYEQYGLNRVVATVHSENLVSQKTMTKAGARVVQHRLEEDGTTTLVFEWLAPSAA